jgi:homoserine kinase
MMTINLNIQTVTAFAAATCANVAVGFDILGFALENVGDYVTLSRRQDHEIIIDTITSNESLPYSTQHNTASAVIKKICQDLNIETGFTLNIRKGIPMSSGMGGSAASAVAALVAFNTFLNTPLSKNELAKYALLGEEVACGQQHPDNIAPCIWGGLTLIVSNNPVEVVQLPIPDVFCVLIHPHLQVATKQARAVLNDAVPLKDHTRQSAHLASFIAALYEKDIALLKNSLSDILIEPQRAQFVPGFYEVKEAALKAGALGVSFSGSGPSIFAFSASKSDAEIIRTAMQAQLENKHIHSDSWISRIAKDAAYVTELL